MPRRLSWLSMTLLIGLWGCAGGGATSDDGGARDAGNTDAQLDPDGSVRPDGGGPPPDGGGPPPDGGGDPCDDVDCSGLDDQCNVGVCDPTDGTCDAVPVATGTACDDGDACTTGDACGGGTCAGAAVDCSGLTDQCNVGVCDPTDGTCDAVPVDAVACNDGNACTTGDMCGGGICAGAAVDCSGLTDQCNAGVCDALTGACAAVPVADTTSCDDGAACTTADVCMGGVCAGAAVDCSGLTDPCNVGTCDALTGACSAVPVADTTSCSDGSLCTTGDVCTGGTCAGSAVDCSGVGDACNAGACDPATGACSLVPVSDGTPCNDGFSCTGADVCTAGVCGARPARFDFESGVTHEWTMTGGNAGWITLPGAGRGGSTAFTNAIITHSQTARTQLDVIYAAPGAVSFWRSTSSEASFDFLRFFIDGVEQQSWSGVTPYARVTFPVTAGAHVFEWRYTKDPSLSSFSDRVYVDDLELIGGVTRMSFERGIPATFVMSGTQPWILSPTANTGTSAMENGDIGDSQSAVTTTTVRIPAAGTVSFFRRVSTEAGWDFLRFYIDGVQVQTWSGLIDYGQVSFPLSAGNHTLEWRYTKDGSLSHNLDTVFVDDIDVATSTCAINPSFPTASATVCRASAGCSSLGAIDTARYYETGDSLQETVQIEAVTRLQQLILQLQMNDQTQGCAVGATHTFDVIVNGTTVGSYSFTTPSAAPAGTISILRDLSFAPVSGAGATGDQYTIRLQATSTVCSGGNSWMWIPGGSVVGL